MNGVKQKMKQTEEILWNLIWVYRPVHRVQKMLKSFYGLMPG